MIVRLPFIVLITIQADAEQGDVPPGMKILDMVPWSELIPWAVLVVLLLVGLFVLRKILEHRKRGRQIAEPDLTIDVSSLDSAGPPSVVVTAFMRSRGDSATRDPINRVTTSQYE